MDASAQIAQYVLYSGIAQAVWAAIFAVGCILIGYVSFRLIRVLNKVEAMLDPLADRGLKVMTNVDETLNSLRGRAESILDAGEKAVGSVATKVDSTSSLIEGAVARPAIRVSSFMAGVQRSIDTWRRFKPSAHNDSHVEHLKGTTAQNEAPEAEEGG
jgi:phage-related protein